MKVCIANKRGDWSIGNTGKGHFVKRLIPALEALGVSVTTEPRAKCDVALHIGHVHYSSRARVDVLRLGPARVSVHEKYRRLNKSKRTSMKLVNGIIYQSRYSKKVFHHFVHKPQCPEVVIFNGDDPKRFENIEPWTSPYSHNFLASTRKWLPQKRLKDLVETFAMLGRNDVCLWVAGNTLGQERPLQKTPNVIFTGPLKQDRVARLLKMADALVHPVYLDACPNSVVEALCAGLRIITTDQGGTQELLGVEDAVVFDKPFRYKPINLIKPPKINRELLLGAMKRVLSMPRERNDFESTIKRISIDVIAREYLGFFKEVLEEKP